MNDSTRNKQTLLAVDIQSDNHRKLKAMAALQNTSMAEITRRLIAAYLDNPAIIKDKQPQGAER